MRYEQAIIVKRHSTTADGFGGVIEGDLTHVYSGWADVQEVAEQYVSQGVVVANEGDAVIFLNEGDTTVIDSGIQHGDEVTILWDRNQVSIDEITGFPSTYPDGSWLFIARPSDVAAAVSSLRSLDNHLMVKYE